MILKSILKSPNSGKFPRLHGFRLRAAFFLFSLIVALAPALILAQMQAAGDPAQPVLSPAARVNTESLSASRVGMRVLESEDGSQLLGEVVPEDFDRLLPGWSAERETYEPNLEDLAALSTVSEPVDIICVLGTWCGDSEREVPRFWKILQEVENLNLVLTLFAVGRATDDAAREVMVEIGFDESLRDVYNVELVPTFIFSRGDLELGRIIETPVGTLEQDAAEILVGNLLPPGAPGQPMVVH